MKILFVVNPISGGVNKEPFMQKAKSICEKFGLDYHIFKTTGNDDEKLLAAVLLNYSPDKVASVGGDGTTVTSDASTVTVAVTGAASSVFKYATSFTPSGTSEIISGHVGTLGTGPYNLSVYEDGEGLIYTGVNYAANGNITLSWSSGAISSDCSVFITG